MPTLTLTTATVSLGLPWRDLLHPELPLGAKAILQALLVAYGFNVSRAVAISDLANGDFLLTQ